MDAQASTGASIAFHCSLLLFINVRPSSTSTVRTFMAPCKLYGDVNSVGTMRVLASLCEHDVEFEFVQIDLNGDHRIPQSLIALNVILS
ncbi:hypothetical protein Nepgr_032837 [Nepenthes gracilis]|uniref:Uncharacterized protein n=1 Tax=Nepenthes gracilis TaxID=150966 RepID=A0AAD3TKU8_NEPGR|nr:hypothetical protein Nepgr_032837 [Nepenthes gracilis]